jgi:hypothetical protein
MQEGHLLQQRLSLDVMATLLQLVIVLVLLHNNVYQTSTCVLNCCRSLYKQDVYTAQ